MNHSSLILYLHHVPASFCYKLRKKLPFKASQFVTSRCLCFVLFEVIPILVRFSRGPFLLRRTKTRRAAKPSRLTILTFLHLPLAENTIQRSLRGIPLLPGMPHLPGIFPEAVSRSVRLGKGVDDRTGISGTVTENRPRSIPQRSRRRTPRRNPFQTLSGILRRRRWKSPARRRPSTNRRCLREITSDEVTQETSRRQCILPLP